MSASERAAFAESRQGDAQRRPGRLDLAQMIARRLEALAAQGIVVRLSAAAFMIPPEAREQLRREQLAEAEHA